MLDVLGLDETATAVYRYLLRSDGATPGMLSMQLGLPLGTVTDALETLTGLGLVWSGKNESARVKSVSPEYGLVALAARREAEVLQRLQKVKGALAYIGELVTEHDDFRSNRQLSCIEMLHSADETRMRIIELASAGRSEILCAHAGNQIAEVAEIIEALHGSRSDPGRPVRILLPDSITKHPARRKQAQLLDAAGVQVRTTTTVPLRMTLIGERPAVIQFESAADTGESLLIHTQVIIAVLTSYFEQLWQRATSLHGPIGGPTPTSPPQDSPLSATEYAVLQMLAEGMTDEAIARRLDISVRTLRRTVLRLTKLLAARSRFETAVLATRYGWV